METKRTFNNPSATEYEKFKDALNAIAEEHICPLSMELMVDPVTGK